MTVRVIAVCMLDSIHAARWLEQFRERDIQFLLLPSSPHRNVHPRLEAIVGSQRDSKYLLHPVFRYCGVPLWLLDQILLNFVRATILRETIKKFKPDYVHAMELQNAGYITLRAMGKGKPPGVRIISTNWGSDIFWFRRFAKHKRKLAKLMQITDVYSAECRRDIDLAKEMGFQGETKPVFPNSGGFTDEELSMPKASLDQRNIIAVKGYQGWSGRAKIALFALEELSGELRDLEIVVFSANSNVVRLAKRIRRRSGLNIKTHKKGALSHRQILTIMSQARIYVGVSRTDGISTSMLEAMAMGAIPVQSASSCANEWYDESGVIISDLQVVTIKNAILAGLTKSEDKKHSDVNARTIKLRASRDSGLLVTAGFYEP